MRTLMMVLLGAVLTAGGGKAPAAGGNLSGWLAFPVRSGNAGFYDDGRGLAIVLSDQEIPRGGACSPYDAPVFAPRLYIFVSLERGARAGVFPIGENDHRPSAELVWGLNAGSEISDLGGNAGTGKVTIDGIGNGSLSGSFAWSIDVPDGGPMSLSGTFSVPVCNH
jgi:hypothetical protein